MSQTSFACFRLGKNTYVELRSSILIIRLAVRDLRRSVARFANQQPSKARCAQKTMFSGALLKAARKGQIPLVDGLLDIIMLGLMVALSVLEPVGDVIFINKLSITS